MLHHMSGHVPKGLLTAFPHHILPRSLLSRGVNFSGFPFSNGTDDRGILIKRIELLRSISWNGP